MAVSQTFVMVKPDGTKRGLVGDIMSRFEHRGFKLIHARQLVMDSAMAEQHYAHLSAKPFFQELVDYITSGPVFAMVWEAENAVQLSRSMIGPTNPAEAAPGTIRGDFGTSVEANVIHGSDCPESAEKEISVFFGR
ncbi:nucleoside-diphosphate kinase [Paenibacillus sp. SN-8-1]|uniref:nucleoside-diphosphate kinase n=1 Tax=Paenibacillus sp. SN-8-1 TaxID=3435409 RepID=UPI003D9A6653